MKLSLEAFIGTLQTLIAAFAFVTSILLVLSALAQYFNPLQAELMALFGLLFPFNYILNFFSFLLLIFLRNRILYLQLLLLLSFSPIFANYIGLNLQNSNTQLSIITYNVHGFKGYNSQGINAQTAEQIAAFIHDLGVDIACIQEFRTWSGDAESDVKHFANAAGMPYYSYSYYWPKGKHLSDIHLIMSKLPQSNQGNLVASTGRNVAHYADIQSTEANIRIISVHLVSFSLDKSEINLFSQGDFLNTSVINRYFPKLSGKLTASFRVRAIEVDDLLRFTNKSALPVVIVGDFNDTPASYTYRRLSAAGFTDTHPRTGRFFGSTYVGRLPLLRIDYVFLPPSFEAASTKVIHAKLSDHYPVIVSFGNKKSHFKSSGNGSI